MTNIQELSSFFNWCDRWCERCPLAGSCPVPGATGSVVEALEQAVTMLEELAEREGISLENLPPPPVPPIEARLLQAAGRAHALALCDLDLVRLGSLVAGKTARIASYLDEDGMEVWDMDAVPNLLLLESLLAEADDEVGRRPRGRVERAIETRRQLQILLAPMLELIPASARRTLEVLVAAGLAPSPFVCTDTPPGPASGAILRA